MYTLEGGRFPLCALQLVQTSEANAVGVVSRVYIHRASSPRLQYLFGTRTGDQNCRNAVVGAQLLVAPFTLFTLYSTLFSSPSNR